MCGKNPDRPIKGQHGAQSRTADILSAAHERFQAEVQRTVVAEALPWVRRGSVVRLMGADSGVRYAVQAVTVEPLQVPGGVLAGVALAVVRRQRGMALDRERIALPVCMMVPVDIEVDRPV